MSMQELTIETEVKKAVSNVARPNIAIMGRTGVGKSSLINAVFGSELAASGAGLPMTQSFARYPAANEEYFPIVVYDSPGYEATKESEWVQLVNQFIKTKKTQGLEEQIHLVWYVINAASARVEYFEREIIEMFTEQQVPTIIVLSQCDRARTTEIEIIEEALDTFELKKFHPVVKTAAEPLRINGKPIIKPFGLTELVDKTIEFLPEIYSDAMIMAQVVDLKAKRELAWKYIASIAAASFAAGFIPIPFATPLASLVSLSALSIQIASIYGYSYLATFLLSVGTLSTSTLNNIFLTSVLDLLDSFFLPSSTISGAVAATYLTVIGLTYVSVFEKLAKSHIYTNGTEEVKEFLRKTFREEFKKYADLRIYSPITLKEVGHTFISEIDDAELKEVLPVSNKVVELENHELVEDEQDVEDNKKNNVYASVEQGSNVKWFSIISFYKQLQTAYKHTRLKIIKYYRVLSRLFVLNAFTGYLIGGCIGLISISFIKDYIIHKNTHLNPCATQKYINLSCGEKILFSSFEKQKENGIKKFGDEKYKEAYNSFYKAHSSQPNDPETQIYLNNSQIMQDKKLETYTIAVPVPISKSEQLSQEILRGVAQAQFEVNNQPGKINRHGLIVVIADDANNPDQAYGVAKNLVSLPNVLGIMGHYASDVTSRVLPVYQANYLPLVSSGSTQDDIRGQEKLNNFFFRTVPKAQITGEALAEHVFNTQNLRKVVVFYSPKSSFSNAITEDFVKKFKELGGSVLDYKNLSDSGFMASKSISGFMNNTLTTGFAIFPDGQVDRTSFANALSVIDANQGKSWMFGGWIMYSNQILEKKSLVEKGRLVLNIPWSRFSIPKGNQEKAKNLSFTDNAEKLWKTKSISPLTALSYDATLTLINALQEIDNSLQNVEKIRVSVKDTLGADNFYFIGATGKVSFINGDRKENLNQMVRIVCSSSEGYIFAPLDYSVKECTETSPNALPTTNN